MRSEFVFTLTISVIQNRDLEGGKERVRFLLKGKGIAEISFPTLGKISARFRKIDSSSIPSLYHIYIDLGTGL